MFNENYLDLVLLKSRFKVNNSLLHLIGSRGHIFDKLCSMFCCFSLFTVTVLSDLRSLVCLSLGG